MFKKNKKPQTVKILITNMKLIDMPPNQNRVFIKIKQGQVCCTTRSFPIVQNQVIFQEPVEFNFNTSVAFHTHKKKLLRFSFRYELANGSGFARYGAVEINPMQAVKEGNGEVKILLENCSYNTYFLCLIISSDEALGYDFTKNVITTVDENEESSSTMNKKALDEEQSNELSKKQIITSNHKRSESSTLVNNMKVEFVDFPHSRANSLSNSITNQKDSVIDSKPLIVSEERYLELEKQIDLLLDEVEIKFSKNV